MTTSASTFKLFKTQALICVWMFCVLFAFLWGHFRKSDIQEHLNSHLLQQARMLAESMNPGLIEILQQAETTVESPEYLRLKRQLYAYRSHVSPSIGLEFVYILARNAEGKPYFLCDDAEVGEEGEAPLGMVYDDAPPGLAEILATGNSGTLGPYTDQWGYLVSGFWPILNPVTGDVLATVGVDMRAESWKYSLRKAYHLPGLFPALVTLVLFAAWVLLLQNSEKGLRSKKGREVCLALCFGGLLSLEFTQMSADHVINHRLNTFADLGEIRGSQIARSFLDVRDRDLSTMAGFFEGQDQVTESEFEIFTRRLNLDGFLVAWHWFPYRENGESMPEYSYFLSDNPHSETASFSPEILGEISKIQQESARSRLTFATDTHRSEHPVDSGFMALQPVFELSPEKTYVGSIGACFLWSRLLEHKKNQNHPLDIRLFEISGEALIDVLTLKHLPPFGIAPENQGSMYRPIFAYGRSFLLLASPSREFLKDSKSFLPWGVGCLGFLLTAMVGLTIHLSASSRNTLEDLVEERTHDLRGIMENSVNALASHLIVLDADGVPCDYTFISVNPAFERITGLKAVDILGRKVTEVLPDVEPSLIQRYGRVTLSQKPESFDYEDPNLKRSFRVSAYPTGPLGFAVAFEDVTDIHEHAREKTSLQMQLTQAQKMESIGRLAGGVAHDFNNTLQVVLGNAELALTFMTLDEKLRSNFMEIRDAATKSSALTRQLLAFARKQSVKPAPLNLNDAVEGSTKLLKRLIGENILLDWQPDPKLWRVNMDPGQVDQILVNLCVNSRDAMPSGGSITLRTRNLPAEDQPADALQPFPPGDCVVLEVMDTGTGIAPEILPLIFEPFMTTKTPDKGTGLGLSTIYGIVRQNNGVIHAESPPGLGAIFRIYLPKLEGNPESPVAHKPQTPLRGSGTILLVEDEPMILQMGTMLIKKLGYHVLSANGPEEALRLMNDRKKPIDLLLTDVIMPSMNGRDLSLRIQKIQPGVKCLFMSGYTADIIGTHGVLDSTVHFIAKPFTLEDLAAKLKEAMG